MHTNLHKCESVVFIKLEFAFAHAVTSNPTFENVPDGNKKDYYVRTSTATFW